jgi:hypothetical protein
MTASRVVLVASLALSAPAPGITASQDQQAGAPTSTPWVTPPQKDPYKDLFKPEGQTPDDNLARAQERLREALRRRQQLQHLQPVAPPGQETPQVVCGMTIIPADPSIDPKMILEVPAGSVDFTIKRIPPPVCR